MSLFTRIKEWFFGAPRKKDPTYRWKRVEDRPEKLERSMVYLIGDTRHPWQAAMVCPCGCGAEIDLSMVKDDSPSWSSSISAEGRITLHPSVWRTKGCRSHFILKEGSVSWAQSISQAPAANKRR